MQLQIRLRVQLQIRLRMQLQIPDQAYRKLNALIMRILNYANEYL